MWLRSELLVQPNGGRTVGQVVVPGALLRPPSQAQGDRRFVEARPGGRVVDVLETALYATDLASAEDFYLRVLELELDSKEPGRHVFFRCGHGMLLIFDPTATSRSGPVPSHGATGPGHVAFAVENEDVLAAWPDRLRRAGIDVEADVHWSDGGRSIYFRDPAGNSLELTTPRIWGLEREKHLI